MNPILLSVLIVSAIGLLAGLGLAVASLVMAVPVDEKAEALEAVLPGANCGACGFSGCAGYAKALSEGKTTDTALCAPGGNAAAKEVASILGLSAGNVVPVAATVLCCGNHTNTGQKFEYSGVQSCKMASQLFGGSSLCSYGCLGYGDCAEACPYDAITICEGVAQVDPLLCRACKMCVNTCPKHLITLMPLHERKVAVMCHNTDKGGPARKACKVACIGCMRCVKACEYSAVTVKNNLAVIDGEKCVACGKCMEVCPSKCIHLFELDAVHSARA